MTTDPKDERIAYLEEYNRKESSESGTGEHRPRMITTMERTRMKDADDRGGLDTQTRLTRLETENSYLRRDTDALKSSIESLRSVMSRGFGHVSDKLERLSDKIEAQGRDLRQELKEDRRHTINVAIAIASVAVASLGVLVTLLLHFM